MSRVIVITSGKGGVGKTTVSAYLGRNLSKRGHSVCVVDMDIGLNNLDVVLGMEDRVLYTMEDVVDGKCRLQQSLVQDKAYPMLYLLSSGNITKNLSISTEHIGMIINKLKDMFDFVLIDCPAGIDAGFNRAIKFAIEALVITTPHLSSIRDADKVVSILKSYNMPSIKFVVNRARGDLIENKTMFSVREISNALKVEFGGVIPEDDYITTSQLDIAGKLNPRIPSVRAFAILAENIDTGSKKLFDCTVKYKGFFGGMRKLLRRKV